MFSVFTIFFVYRFNLQFLHEKILHITQIKKKKLRKIIKFSLVFQQKKEDYYVVFLGWLIVCVARVLFVHCDEGCGPYDFTFMVLNFRFTLLGDISMDLSVVSTFRYWFFGMQKKCVRKFIALHYAPRHLSYKRILVLFQSCLVCDCGQRYFVGLLFCLSVW